MSTPEERAEWRKDAERRRDGRGNTPQNQRILALLDELDLAAGDRILRSLAESRARDMEIERNMLRSLLGETLAMLEALTDGEVCS